jgi:hypothetical protein
MVAIGRHELGREAVGATLHTPAYERLSETERWDFRAGGFATLTDPIDPDQYRARNLRTI